MQSIGSSKINFLMWRALPEKKNVRCNYKPLIFWLNMFCIQLSFIRYSKKNVHQPLELCLKMHITNILNCRHCERCRWIKVVGVHTILIDIVQHCNMDNVNDVKKVIKSKRCWHNVDSIYCTTLRCGWCEPCKQGY